MDRLWTYLEARMPECGEKKRTVNCKFTVNTARMLIKREKLLCRGWIPVSKSTPECGVMADGSSAYVMITILNESTGVGVVRFDRYDGHSGTWYDNQPDDGSPLAIVAWMPCPDPYSN